YRAQCVPRSRFHEFLQHRGRRRRHRGTECAMTTATTVRAGIAAALVSVLVPAVSACAKGSVPVAVPEPVASTSTGAVEFYTRVQQDVIAALSAEFPELEFTRKYGSTNAGCRLGD